ncbi:hypothetical protein DEH69_14735 [Streptomyces sp. PT12]|nr:hypothetical protein DEH69_14735 [Streptomyces sp. PT12]
MPSQANPTKRDVSPKADREGGVPAQREARLQVVGRADLFPHRWHAVLLAARPQSVAGVDEELLRHDPAQCLQPWPRREAGLPLVGPREQVPGVHAGLRETGDRMAGLTAQAHRPPVALTPLGCDQVVEEFGGGVGDFLQSGTNRLRNQLQTGQIACGGEDCRRRVNRDPLPAGER